MKSFFIPSLVYSLGLSILSTGVQASAHASSSSIQVSAHIPSVYAVLQQQGSVCPLICFENLKRVKEARSAGERRVDLESMRYSSKTKAYAEFLPQVRAYDRALDKVRFSDGPYAAYEANLRQNGIYDQYRYYKGNKHISNQFWNPLSNLRAESYAPYTFQIETPYFAGRRLPIKSTGTTMTFYDHETGKTEILLNSWDPGFNPEKSVELYQGGRYHVSDEILEKMNITRAEAKDYAFFVTVSHADSQDAFVSMANSKSDLYRTQDFYDQGTLKHMLFAMGVDGNNQDIDPNHELYPAYRELKEAMDEEPRNPWANIQKNDLFEYHLAVIFQENPNLKARAEQAIDYYNDAWKYYKRAPQYFDEQGVSLSEKMGSIPGEDQALAYIFSQELRFAMAASVGMEAVIETMDIREELGNTVTSLLKKIVSTKSIIKAAVDKKYEDENGKFSFLDVWQQLRGAFLENVGEQKDFVTFSSHGCVMSLDPELVNLQHHDHPEFAEELGFVHWEQLYDKGLRPFYKKAGTEDDIINFN